jgi:predicted enzyme related to lactoylglutathione lyase
LGNDQPGGRVGVWLHCGEITVRKNEKTGVLTPASKPENVERTYLELKNRGVQFSEELTTTDLGKYAILRDPDGNEFEIS